MKQLIAVMLCVQQCCSSTLLSVHVLQRMHTSSRVSAGSECGTRDPLFQSKQYKKLSAGAKQCLCSLLACPAKRRPLASEILHDPWLCPEQAGMNVA